MKKAFTLLELMIVIVILGVLAALISGQFISSLKKGRDAKRKADLEQIQRALDFYYEDNKKYPDEGIADGQLDLARSEKLCHPSGCSTKTYIYKLPEDAKSDCTYDYTHEEGTNGEGYSLYTTLENTQDQGPGVNQSGYTSGNCSLGASPDALTSTCTCRFKISSPNYP